MLIQHGLQQLEGEAERELGFRKVCSRTRLRDASAGPWFGSRTRTRPQPSHGRRPFVIVDAVAELSEDSTTR